MKAQVLGIKVMHGLGKESGEPFEMARLSVIFPIENVSNAKITIHGYGYEVGEMIVDAKALPQFAGFKYPCLLELVTESTLYRGKVDQVVTGTTSQPAVKPVSSNG